MKFAKMLSFFALGLGVSGSVFSQDASRSQNGFGFADEVIYDFNNSIANTNPNMPAVNQKSTPLGNGQSVGATGERIAAPAATTIGTETLTAGGTSNSLEGAEILANRGKFDLGNDAVKNARSAAAARDARREVEKTMRELEDKAHNIQAQANQAKDPNQKAAFLKQPESPFTCMAFDGNCKDNNTLLKIKEPLLERYKEVYQQLEAKENEFVGNVHGDIATGQMLAGHVNQLGKTINNMKSDMTGGGAAGGMGSTVGQGLMAHGLKSSGDGTQTAAIALDPTGKTDGVTRKGGTSGKAIGDDDIEGSSGGKVAEAKFSANLGDVKDEKEVQKLLGTTALVPENFLKDLEGKLSKISQDKDALAIIQEMGKSAGIDELANLKSLDQLSELEKQGLAGNLAKGEGGGTEASGAAGSAGASAAAGGAGGSAAGEGSEMADALARTQHTEEAMSDDNAAFMAAVKNVVARSMNGGKEENASGEVDINYEGGSRKVASAGRDGIGGPSTDVFQRLRHASHTFFRNEYMSKKKSAANTAHPQS